MRVRVNADKCEAHGECVLAAPEVFDLDEETLVSRVLIEEPDESLQPGVRAAEGLCPVRAVVVED
jgi:ferredoxin